MLRLARRPRESREAIAEAVRLYEAKGNIVLAERLRSLLAEPQVEV